MKNPFITEYEDIVKNDQYDVAYINQVRTLIKRKSPEATDEEIDRFIDERIRAKLIDPKVVVLARDPKTEDRSVVATTFSQLLNQAKEEDLIMTPSLAFNWPQTVKRSITGGYIQEGLEKRNLHRRQAFVEQFKGNMDGYNFYWSEQNTDKIKNNSLSGARKSKFTILYLASGHSQLTSGCRMGTSTANLHNERFVGGNRFYYNLDIVESNIAYVMEATNRELVFKAMLEYDLHIPTYDEVFKVIASSANRYFGMSKEMMTRLIELISIMDDIDRVSFVYSGDLYQMFEFNTTLMTDLIESLAHVPEIGINDPELQEKIMDTEFDVISHVSLRCSDIVSGKRIDQVKEENPEGYATVVAMVDNIRRVVFSKYETLIKAFIITNITPANVGQALLQRRTVVPLSDTDSTIYTVERWVEKITGTLKFNSYTNGIASAVAMMSSLVIRHWMGQLVTNINVPLKYRGSLKMSAEYYMPVVAQTGVSKHYAYLNAAEDGNVYGKAKLVLKGVGLRNSTWASTIRKHHSEFVDGTLRLIYERGDISVADVLTPVYEMEKAIDSAVRNGDMEFLGHVRMNPKEMYSKPMSTNYQYYDMWNDVFAPKYGPCGETPVAGVKVPVSLTRVTDLRRYMAWLEKTHPDTFNRMSAWLDKTGKDKFTNIVLPYNFVVSNGLPEELKSIVNTRSTIVGQMRGYYLFLTTFNILYGDVDGIRLVSDEFTPPAA